MQYFVLEDMLPAGLEPLDTSLKTVSGAARIPPLAGLVRSGPTGGTSPKPDSR
jgi:hypothetical protein